jgi:hypothetical protein
MIRSGASGVFDIKAAHYDNILLRKEALEKENINYSHSWLYSNTLTCLHPESVAPFILRK